MFRWPRCEQCGAAPRYSDRIDYLPAGFSLTIYVPTGNHAWWCAPGSAVVGPPTSLVTDDNLTVYYEGWVNGGRPHQDARAKWVSGVQVAASRLLTEYPTSATMRVSRSDLEAVGSFNPRTRQFNLVNEDLLGTWLDCEEPTTR